MAELSEMVNDLASITSREILLEKIKGLLDPIKMPANEKEIPEMPIHELRGLSVNEAELLKELLKVRTIRDLSKITYTQVMQRIDLIRQLIPQEKLELLLTASKYIVKAVDYKPKVGQKVVVAGLDNAGKTAILNTIKKEVGFSELSSLKPTRGASRDDIFLADQQILLVELGGQEEFRKFYIDQPDRFFLETDIIVYLIDMKDDTRYQESIDYLQQILRTVKYLQESPDFIILFHKADPDIMSGPMFQEKFEYLERKVKESFQPYKKFRYEVQTSSIFNIVSMTPSFSRMLKGLFSGSALAEEEKIGAIGKLLMKVVDLFLDMETHLNQEVNSISQRLNKMEYKLKHASLVEGPKSKEPEESSSDIDKTSEKEASPASKVPEKRGGMSTRSALISELKAVFGVRGKID